nr:MAG TPA: hypothetical protein [Caudoviricetes sp.]
MILAEDLRKAVLQAAIQGKLTQRMSSDSDVDALLNKIHEEKALLAERKNARKDKEFGEISESEIEFDIPDSWRWIRVGDIGAYKKGPFGSSLTKSMFVPKGPNSVKVYEQKNAIQKDASLGEYYITREYYDDKMSGFHVESGDIIVSCAGTIGETYVMPENIELGIINQALMRMNIAESINLGYFLYYFDHVLKTNAKKSSNGSAIKNIPPFDVFKKMLFPVPPIEEQQRIVEKLNHILAEIDEYSSAEQELIVLESAFPDDMRKSILQYAMQGKLVEQRQEEGTGEELYQQIQAEKAKLIKEGKIKKEKPLAAITESEISFDIPENWKWVRLGDLCELISGSDLKPEKYNDKGKGIPYITGASNINDDGSIIINRWVEEPNNIAVRDDLLITCKGTVGKIAILQEDQVHIARQIMAVRVFRRMSRDYLQMCLSNYVALLNRKAKSMIPGIDRKNVLNLMIPLPPLAEQKRIISKLNLILPHIEELKEAI